MTPKLKSTATLAHSARGRARGTARCAPARARGASDAAAPAVRGTALLWLEGHQVQGMGVQPLSKKDSKEAQLPRQGRIRHRRATPAPAADDLCGQQIAVKRASCSSRSCSAREASSERESSSAACAAPSIRRRSCAAAHLGAFKRKGSSSNPCAQLAPASSLCAPACLTMHTNRGRAKQRTCPRLGVPRKKQCWRKKGTELCSCRRSHCNYKTDSRLH